MYGAGDADGATTTKRITDVEAALYTSRSTTRRSPCAGKRSHNSPPRSNLSRRPSKRITACRQVTRRLTEFWTTLSTYNTNHIGSGPKRASRNRRKSVLRRGTTSAVASFGLVKYHGTQKQKIAPAIKARIIRAITERRIMARASIKIANGRRIRTNTTFTTNIIGLSVTRRDNIISVQLFAESFSGRRWGEDRRVSADHYMLLLRRLVGGEDAREDARERGRVERSQMSSPSFS